MSGVVLASTGFIETSPLPIMVAQDPIIMGVVIVYVHEFITYIVSPSSAHPFHVERYTTFVGTQLESRSLVYAVDHGIQSPKRAYLIFSVDGFCSQKSCVIKPHHCRFADVGVKIFDAPQSIPTIANKKNTKA